MNWRSEWRKWKPFNRPLSKDELPYIDRAREAEGMVKALRGMSFEDKCLVCGVGKRRREDVEFGS